jgi:hypothetical protein
VKLSTEGAEAISITPVVIEEIQVRELVEHILGVTGKDEARIREILGRGILVSGGSRFRWTGWQAEPASLAALLSTFPDSDASLQFSSVRCIRALLHGGRNIIEITREAGARKSFFRRTAFWDSLMQVITGATPVYDSYSYRARADRFVCPLSRGDAEQIRAAASGVTYSTLRDQIRTSALARAELWVTR